MKNIRWLVLFLTLVSSNLWSEKPIGFESKINIHNEEKGQIGTANFPLFIAGKIYSIKSEEEFQKEEKERKANAENDAKLVEYTRYLAISTFLLFVFTAGLWWVTYRLSVASKDAGAKQAKEMESSLAIAKEAAQAAISGNELNQKIFISSQRPWVTVQEIIPRSSLNFNENGLSFTMIVRNVGRSPAMNTNISAIMHLSYKGNIDAHQVHKNMRDEIARDRKELVSNESNLGYLIVPGEALEISVQAGYSLAEFQKAAFNHPFREIIILIIGQVTYGSGIDESQYESGFIFSVRGRGNSGILLDDNNMPIEVEISRFGAGFYAT